MPPPTNEVDEGFYMRIEVPHVDNCTLHLYEGVWGLSPGPHLAGLK